MLGGDQDLLDRDGLVVHVADRNLGLAIRAQVAQHLGPAHGGQAFGQAVGQVDRHGHQLAGVPAGVAEHHALVARAHQVQGILALAALDFEAFVHAHGDVGALLVDGAHDPAGVGVKAVFGAIVADLGDHLADDLLDIHVGPGADFAAHDNHAGGDEGLAGHASVLDAAVGIRTHLDFAGHDGIQHGIRDLVADLVGMAFGDGFGSKKILALGHLSSFWAPPGEPLHGGHTRTPAWCKTGGSPRACPGLRSARRSSLIFQALVRPAEMWHRARLSASVAGASQGSVPRPTAGGPPPASR